MLNPLAKKACASSLGLVMVVSTLTSPANAQSSDDAQLNIDTAQVESSYTGSGDYSITQVSPNIQKVSLGDTGEELFVEESDQYRIASFNNNGKQEYLQYDKIEGTLYSSITNQTVDMAEHNIQPAAHSTTSYHYDKYSYARIRSIVGDVTAIVGFAAFIATFYGPIAGAAAAVGGACAVIGGVNVLIPNTTRHGLRFKIKTVKYRRRRLGRWNVYKIVKSIESVSGY